MPEAKRLRVLIVEDRLEDAQLIKRALCRNPDSIFQCEIVGLVETAIEVLNGGGVDYVILDLCLPDAIGFEGLLKLSKHKVPIIVATGRDNPHDAARAIEEYGAIAYIVKPMDMDIFYRAFCDAIVRTNIRRHLDWKIKIAIALGILSVIGAVLSALEKFFILLG